MQKNYNEAPKGCSTTLPDTALMGIVAESAFGKKSEGHVGNTIVTFSLASPRIDLEDVWVEAVAGLDLATVQLVFNCVAKIPGASRNLDVKMMLDVLQERLTSRTNVSNLGSVREQVKELFADMPAEISEAMIDRQFERLEQAYDSLASAAITEALRERAAQIEETSPFRALYMSKLADKYDILSRHAGAKEDAI